MAMTGTIVSHASTLQTAALIPALSSQLPAAADCIAAHRAPSSCGPPCWWKRAFKIPDTEIANLSQKASIKCRLSHVPKRCKDNDELCNRRSERRSRSTDGGRCVFRRPFSLTAQCDSKRLRSARVARTGGAWPRGPRELGAQHCYRTCSPPNSGSLRWY